MRRPRSRPVDHWLLTVLLVLAACPDRTPPPRTAPTPPPVKELLERLHVAEASQELETMAAEEGPALEPAVPLLLERLAALPAPDRDHFRRHVILRALGSIRARPDGVVPALIRELELGITTPGCEGSMAQAALALGAYGPAADAALPALVAALESPTLGRDNDVIALRGTLCEGLGQVAAGSGDPRLSALVLRVGRADVHSAALGDLAASWIGDASVTRGVVERYREGLGLLPDSVELPGRVVAHDLARLYEAIWRLDSALLSGLEPIPPGWRVWIQEAHALQARDDDEGPVPTARRLAEIVSTPAAGARRRQAALALAWLDPATPGVSEVAPALVRALEGDDPRLACTAAMALAWLRRAEAAPALRARVEHPDPRVRQEVGRALAALSR